MTPALATISRTATAARPTGSFEPARPPAGGFDEELRRLLRSRLILVHLLALAYVVLLEVMIFCIHVVVGDPRVGRDNAGPLLTVPFVQSLIGAVVFWRSPGLSLRALRLGELLHFGMQVAFFGWIRYSALVSVGRETPPLELGFLGAVTLFYFITVILAYGVLIPNTRRRSLGVVLALTAVPFVALIAAAVANPVVRGVLPVLVFQAAANLLFPAAIAVFAAARANALQRRAFEAERRAEQVGPYALKRLLGRGGMGEVWLGEHRLVKRPCAVKLIHPELAAHPATVARFQREVQAVTGLSHPNTVRVFDYGRAEDGAFYFVMEYLDGATLDALVRRAGPLPPGRVVYLLRQVCGALAEAHAAGLVHRDIKPGNVIVAILGGQPDVAKLLDFGLVHDATADPADGRLTRTGTVMGTPAYMCPEQAGGESAADARGDLYSLGAVAFFALTGRPPFDEPSVGKLLAAHLTQPAPDVRAVRPDVPADLAVVVARCLAKDPADRFASAAELERALARCGCAADWSAEPAAAWWAGRGDLTRTGIGDA